jgi:hypothetical protein
VFARDFLAGCDGLPFIRLDALDEFGGKGAPFGFAEDVGVPDMKKLSNARLTSWKRPRKSFRQIAAGRRSSTSAICLFCVRDSSIISRSIITSMAMKPKSLRWMNSMIPRLTAWLNRMEPKKRPRPQASARALLLWPRRYWATHAWRLKAIIAMMPSMPMLCQVLCRSTRRSTTRSPQGSSK